MGDSYIELLPAVFRIVNDYGLTIDNRTYDCQPSALWGAPMAGLGPSGREQEEMGGPLRSLRHHRRLAAGPPRGQVDHRPVVHRSPYGQPFGLVLWEHVRRNPI